MVGWNGIPTAPVRLIWPQIFGCSLTNLNTATFRKKYKQIDCPFKCTFYMTYQREKYVLKASSMKSTFPKNLTANIWMQFDKFDTQLHFGKNTNKLTTPLNAPFIWLTREKNMSWKHHRWKAHSPKIHWKASSRQPGRPSLAKSGNGCLPTLFDQPSLCSLRGILFLPLPFHLIFLPHAILLAPAPAPK